MRIRILASAAGVVACLGLVLPTVRPFPLDGYEYTGIRRLRAYRLQIDGVIPGTLRLQPGAMLPSGAIRLRLQGINDSLDPGPGLARDPELQAALERIVGPRDTSYRVALLDITDPAKPRYAAIRPTQGYIPGSVGKLLVMTGLFNELRKLYPNDIDARARVLRETQVVADRFVVPNSHAVPVVNDEMSAVQHRSIRVGDVFSLWEWVDHMISPSSNAAGSMVWKQALLLNEYGRAYPPSPEEETAFFARTSKRELSERSIRILEEPLVAVGIDTAQLKLRTYFTAGAQRVIPGQASLATPQELVRWLVRLEQGRLVDSWSSLEMKKMLYFTRRRYRYAASAALNDAAVFFKSGSLYECRPEPGYQCGQYRGNARNLMHSVAIVEAPASGPHQRVYLVSLMSNVLKLNSAGAHMEIGTQIERALARLHPAPSPQGEGSR